MDENDAYAKLDALVGAALKCLVEAGASNEAIGSSAEKFRQEASQILGVAEQNPAEPELGELVQQAVKQALTEAGVLKNRARPRAKRFYVMVQGQRTSVLIGAQEAEQLVKEKGRRGANKIIEELAQSAPRNVPNRSGWIQEQLRSGSFFTQASAHAPGSTSTH